MTDETEDDPDNDEKVVELFPEVEQPPLQVKYTSRDDKCKHPVCTLDETIRLCVCSDCGARIEPFDWLVEHCGNDWTRYWDIHIRVRKDISRLAVEREDMRREVKNLKAQVNRWRATAAKLQTDDPPELDPAPVALKSTPGVSG